MPRRPLLSRFRSQNPKRYYLRSKHLFAEVPVPRRPRRGPRASANSLVTVSLTESETVLLTQQAPVRRGPRASATSLVTVSLAESEADAFLPNRRLRNSCSYPQSPGNLKTKELDFTEFLFDVMCIEKTSFFYDFS